MAEEEVNYASVVFKSHKQPPEGSSEAAPPKKEEETVYDEVNVQSNATEQPADATVSAELLPDKKANNGFSRLQQLMCCLGILCVLLLAGLIGLCVHVALSSDQRELSQLRETNDKLRSDNTNLESNNTNLTVQLDKLTGNYTDLKSQTTDLTVQLDRLTGNYTDLKSQTTDLTGQLDKLTRNYTDLKSQNTNLTTRNQDLEMQQRNWKELNVSRAQWSVDAYCPKTDNKRSCHACQKGWKTNKTLCYAINNPSLSEEKTWEGAREDCRGKSADLAVVDNDEEKNTILYYSWNPPRKYWLGLKVEDGQWKWIDGTNLTRSDWVNGLAVSGRCAASVQNQQKWSSVRCDERKRWICTKNALSV